MTAHGPAEADDTGTWETAPARRLPGDIAARIRAAREAGVEERHIRVILAEAFTTSTGAAAATRRGDQGRAGT